MSPVLTILIFLSALLAFEGIYFFVQDRRNGNRSKSRKRLRQMALTLRDPETPREESILRRGRGAASRIDQALHAIPWADAIELRIYRAGLSMSLKRFLAVSACFALAGWLVGSTFFLHGLPSLAFVATGLLPWLNAGRLATKRMRVFEQQLPDALDLLIRALRAGHSLSIGLQMVGQELPDPIGREFGQVADEIQLGQSMSNALANLVYRIESPDLGFLVIAISIQQETGSNLAEVLENLAHVIRERFKLYGKVRALTAIGRASANLLAVWPVVMVASLVAVNRDYVAPLWETSAGHTMVAIALVMIAVGYVVCRRMAVIEV